MAKKGHQCALNRWMGGSYSWSEHCSEEKSLPSSELNPVCAVHGIVCLAV